MKKLNMNIASHTATSRHPAAPTLHKTSERDGVAAAVITKYKRINPPKRGA